MVVCGFRFLSTTARLVVRWTRVAMHRAFFKIRNSRKLCWLMTASILTTALILITSLFHLRPLSSSFLTDPHTVYSPSPVAHQTAQDKHVKNVEIMTVQKVHRTRKDREPRKYIGLDHEAGVENVKNKALVFSEVRINGQPSRFSAKSRGSSKTGGFGPSRVRGPQVFQDLVPKADQNLKTRQQKPQNRLNRGELGDMKKMKRTRFQRPLHSPSENEDDNNEVEDNDDADEELVRKRRPSKALHREHHVEAVTMDDGLLYLLQAETRSPGIDQNDRHYQRTDQSLGRGTQEDCKPRQHVFFAKVHKTGSSTVANILQRYGFARRLNFVLPRKRVHSTSYNYLSFPGQRITPRHLIPPPKGQTYDILWNHAVYDGRFFHRIMPRDTLFVSILRHPLHQFVSTFEYYGRMSGGGLNVFLNQNASNPLAVYLHNASMFPWLGGPMSYVRNKQAQDLGMNRSHLFNSTLRQHYIQQLGQDFHWVMITELFDESLVMLRRLLCWEVKDILYIPRNRTPHKKKRTFTAEDKQAHRKLNAADYSLYEFFLKRLKKTLAEQSEDFRREVEYFKALQKGVQAHCGNKGRREIVMVVAGTAWHREFSVSRRDCRLMQKHELLFMDDLVVDAVRRYQKSLQENR